MNIKPKKFILTNGNPIKNLFQDAGAMNINTVFFIAIILFSVYMIYKYNPFKSCDKCKKVNGFKSTNKHVQEEEEEEEEEEVETPLEVKESKPVKLQENGLIDNYIINPRDPITSRYPYLEYENSSNQGIQWKRFDSLRY
jgi:hypothetical protein